MRVVRLAAAAACTLLWACGDAPAGPPPPPPEPEPQDPVVAELVDLVNAHRATVGCDRLRWHVRTAAVAEAHSRDMVDRGFFGHENPDGASFPQRLTAAGVRWDGFAAENLAVEHGGPQAVLDLWLASDFPRTAIELCAFTHHGAGLVESRWTHLFIEDPF